MKISFYLLALGLLMGRGVSFAQETHLIDSQEIPLDDFPALVDGYRIQIGAFKSENGALQLKEILDQQHSGVAHLRYEKGRWRVRVGDFLSADSARQFLRAKLQLLGYEDAEIVQDMIPRQKSDQPVQNACAGYRLQLYALSGREGALQKARNLTCLFPDLQIHVLLQDDLYKVQMGDFRDRQLAEAWKASITGVADLSPIIIPEMVEEVPAPRPRVVQPAEIFQFDD